MIFYKVAVEDYDATDEWADPYLVEETYFISLDKAKDYCKNYEFKKNFIKEPEWYEDTEYFEYECGYTDKRFYEHAYVEKLETED